MNASLQEECQVEPVSLTGRKTNHGWEIVSKVEGPNILKNATHVAYLGKCHQDGDMFAVTIYGYIRIYRGFLKSGLY
jgi:hypothetical protein